jgi:ribA/ribD-fused uncharacterized protein
MTPTPCSCCGATLISSFNGPHHFLSNFYESPMEVQFDDASPFLSVPTLEHAFQALKAEKVEYFDWICSSPTPHIAKARGRRVRMRGDWDNLRLLVMKNLLLEKFARGSELGERLVNTGGAVLVEGNNWGDRFWGTVGGSGQNHLGRLLMEVREELTGWRQ